MFGSEYVTVVRAKAPCKYAPRLHASTVTRGGGQGAGRECQEASKKSPAQGRAKVVYGVVAGYATGLQIPILPSGLHETIGPGLARWRARTNASRDFTAPGGGTPQPASSASL